MSNQNLKYTLSLQDLFTGKMNAAIKQTQQLDSSFNSLGSKLKTLAVGLGVGALGKSVLDTGVQFDSMRMRLETLLGSSQKAAGVFEQIKKDAASTPFDVASLVQANSLLIGAGVSAGQARTDVLGLGNAIAATGGGTDELSRMAVNLQQIKTLGKASAMDVKQFAFAGIPIYQMLAKSTGKSVAELKEMDVTYEQLTDSFAKASQKGGMFFKGLENQSKTVGGQISNLKDQFTFLLYDVFNQLKPAIFAIVKGLSMLLSVVKLLMPLIKTAVILWTSYWLKLKLATIESYSFAVAQRAMAMGISKTTIATTFLKRGIQGIGMAIKAVPILGWVLALVDAIKYCWDTFSGFRESVYAFMSVFSNMGKVLKLNFQGIGLMLESVLTRNQDKMKEALMKFSEADGIQKGAALSGIIKGKKEFNAENGIGGALGGSMGATGGVDANGNASGKGLGSGTEVSGARPQSLTINIEKLVEKLEISTQNIQGGYAQIKEQVTKVLLESVNDLNMITR